MALSNCSRAVHFINRSPNESQEILDLLNSDSNDVFLNNMVEYYENRQKKLKKLNMTFIKKSF